MRFESLIFDIDGTLWDSRALVAEGYNQQLRQEGLNVPLDALSDEECAAALRTPDELFPALNTHLETVPFAEEKRHYVRMNEVFHYNRPTENDPWRDKEQGQPFGRLNRLRPEMISSYIFYHNQLQEEKQELVILYLK